MIGSTAPRVALVHDWLTGMRGGEKVLEALCELYPAARLFTLVRTPGSVSAPIEALRPRASLLSRLPASRRLYRHFLPLYPAAVECFDLDGFDLVISSSHCAAKSVVRPGGARHLCYCHTPMRYVWDQRDAYFGPGRVGRFPAAALRPVLAWLARWDAATSGRVDRYVANSRHVAHRIGRYYNRRAEVIYPPVDTGFFCPDGRSAGRHALVVSALVPYKRVEVAIEACGRAGVPLRVVGQGPDLESLRKRARGHVDFLGALPDEDVREAYRDAAVVLLPGEEDFGIVPVEAQACGRPVVALARGGALETVRDGETGVLVRDESVDAFADAIDRALGTRFDERTLQAHAGAFGRERFVRDMASAVDALMTAPATQVRW